MSITPCCERAQRNVAIPPDRTHPASARQAATQGSTYSTDRCTAAGTGCGLDRNGDIAG